MGFFSALSAGIKVQAIKNDSSKFAKLSLADISFMIFNMQDAQRTLSPEKYNEVYSTFKEVQKNKVKIEMNIDGYYDLCKKLIILFDTIAPCETYLGMEPLEASLLLEEVRKELTIADLL